MMKLFSIKPIYSDKIYKKEKLVELRRQNVNVASNERCLIYTTAPVKKITGYFVVKEKLRLPLAKLWTATKKVAGVSKKIFYEYFKGCQYGTAIVFKFAKNFTEYIDVFSIFSDFVAPQSYYKIGMAKFNKMERKFGILSYFLS